MYGTMGVLYEEDGKVQCHICGRFFKSVSHHVIQTHHISIDNYTEEFGLNRQTSLISTTTKELMKQSAYNNFSRYWEVGLGKQVLSSLTKEQRSVYTKGRTHRLEQHINGISSTERIKKQKAMIKRWERGEFKNRTKSTT